MLKDKTLETKLNELFSEWQQMDRNSPDASKAALAFYDEQIFPLVKKVFLNKPTNRPNKEYDVLILTVGFSPEPLILSILAIEHERVALLYTEETAKFLPRIQDETNLLLSHLATREIDGSSTVEVYETIIDLYTRWGKPKNIAVDITGGKKSMVGGAAMAGAALGADIYYVDNTSFILGKPEPGSEYLSLLDNPYTVFGDLEVEKARNLYNGHDYVGAQRIFDQLKTQVRVPNKTIFYEAYEYLCTAYEAWDNIDFGKACTFLDRLLNILEQFQTLDELNPLSVFQSRLKEQKEALECLLQFLKNHQLALAAPNGFHFAFTLYHNALRREAQGKLDMACLILYRLLEWIGQYRLALYDIDTRQPNYSNPKLGMHQDKLFEGYIKTRKNVFARLKQPYQEISTFPDRIGLLDGYFILAALEDEIVKDLNWSELWSRIQTRNQGIFAHGMGKVEQKDFKAFKSTVKEIFKKAQDLENIDADAFDEQHKFITPLP